MKEQIHEALLKLDPKNDAHWTVDGAPKLDQLGIDGLKRSDVIKAAPQFSRMTPKLATIAEEKAEEAKKVAAANEVRAKVAQEATTDAILVATAEYDEATEIVAEIFERMNAVQLEYKKAVAEQDIKARALDAVRGRRSSQDDIMDYIAAQNARRFAAATKKD